jgi:hypothetical protein
MRKSLQIAAAAAIFPIAALATPASAGLQLFYEVTPGSPASIQCPTSASSCDYISGTNTLKFSPSPFEFNGVIANGSLYAATGVPGAPGVDRLSETALAIINTSDVEKTVHLVSSETDFGGPVSKFELSTSGTFQATLGSTMTVNWYADPTNTQGADVSGNTPGVLLDTYTVSATGFVQSFSFNNQGSFLASGPFSMTETATYDLAPFGELLSRGVDLTVVPTGVPETSTWAMMALGFAGLGFAGYRSSRPRVAFAD